MRKNAEENLAELVEYLSNQSIEGEIVLNSAG